MRQFRMRFRAQLARKKSKPSIPLSGREVIAKSAPTILAKPVGVGVASQPWILRREQSELLTHCGDGKRYVVRAEEKLTGFLNWNRRSGSYRRNPRNLRFNDVFVPSKNCLDTVSGGLNIHAALSRLGVSPQELHLAFFPQG